MFFSLTLLCLNIYSIFEKFPIEQNVGSTKVEPTFTYQYLTVIFSFFLPRVCAPL
jgi:hypothetical protein